ncbi:DEKNAAC104503 [Brettanomyces naardenensis]|uniref:Sulfhydryl oxidase n=1 Tax=Brettanomyces naardenensis TaxID=13370 RepID=A0A448YRR4_BRENA|nr:DEKNAAC104503 [Brettanomyces naardenensis]
MRFLVRNGPGMQRFISRMATRSPGITILALVIVTTVLYFLSNTSFNDAASSLSNLDQHRQKLDHTDRIPSGSKNEKAEVEVDIPFMPKMGNATLRMELGRASWKLFHTILARYPDEPTGAQRDHLDTYIESFAQVYPCGDCARHFVKLLEKYPPQLNSRKNAAVWGCHIHNQVNKVLHHDIYDCATILEDYDCGCGADEESADYTLHGKSLKEMQDEKNDESDTQEHLDSIKVESKEEHIGG